MAGSYPDPPGVRIEYDLDGSNMVWFNSPTVSPLTVAQMGVMNKESTGSSFRLNVGEWLACIFPQGMTIQAAYTAGNQGGASHAWGKLQSSSDTTTGLDGTWSDLEVAKDLLNNGSNINPEYRTQATPMFLILGSPAANVRGIRMYATSNGSAGWDIKTFHIYGYRTDFLGNWLTMWHPTLNQPLTDTPGLMDLGNKPRNTGNVDFSFRIRNSSVLLTANGIALARDALTDGSPSIVASTTLSYDGGTFGTTASVGNLAPGATSGVCVVRINIGATAPIGIWAAPRVLATATTWTS